MYLFGIVFHVNPMFSSNNNNDDNKKLQVIFGPSFNVSVIYICICDGLMQELGTDTNLYALVFGESVLNDAVSCYHYHIGILCSC
jgi:hypothetical protein